MDSFEFLLNKTMISQESANKEDKEKSKSKKKKNFNKIIEVFLDNSPRSPVFRPQESPKDNIPEIFLPLSDLSTDENEESGTSQDNKKGASNNSNTTLNIWLSKDFYEESGEFELIYENSESKVLVNENALNKSEAQNNLKPAVLNNQAEQEHAQSNLLGGCSEKPYLKQVPVQNNTSQVKRHRSQSENISTCTIFEFLEKNKINQN